LKNIEAIVSDLEQQRAAIIRALDALRLVGQQPAPKRRGRPPGTKNPPVTKKRRLSPEGRARIIEATRKRWAAVRGDEPSA
jgi:hypothetical protein